MPTQNPPYSLLRTLWEPIQARMLLLALEQGEQEEGDHDL